MRIKRDINEPSTYDRSWEERWRGPDRGLIAFWERGLAKAKEDPDLAKRVRQGELAVLPWNDGVEKSTQARRKYAPLKYLAAWQGLRGEPLDIALDQEVTLKCTRTEMEITYTADQAKIVKS